jgi:hypothetical protein
VGLARRPARDDTAVPPPPATAQRQHADPVPAEQPQPPAQESATDALDAATNRQQGQDQLAQASRETQSTSTPTSVVVTALTSCLRGMATILERDLDALLQRHGAASTQQRVEVLQQLVVDSVVTPWAELNDDGEAERKVLDFQELPFEENLIAADEYRHAALQDGISMASDFGAPASVAPSIPSILRNSAGRPTSSNAFDRPRIHQRRSKPRKRR